MKVIKVIVDKLPCDCEVCQFVELPWRIGEKCKCIVEQRVIRTKDKPDWCPLVTEPVITIKEHTHYLTVHDLDIKDGTLTVSFEVKHEV